MSKSILKIKKLNVEFPLFGGILQREVTSVHAVKNLSMNSKKITSLYRDGAIALAPDGVPQHPGQPFDTQQES